MIDYYLDKKLEIKAQQTILKQNSIKLMRELKDMKKTNYFNDNEVKYSISEERRQWINTLKNPNNQFNLAHILSHIQNCDMKIICRRKYFYQGKSLRKK